MSTANPTQETSELVPLPRLAEQLVGVTADSRWGDLSATLITGGKSNLTFAVSSPAGEVILRRPPSGAVLATAHDMGREVRVQRALVSTTVPVPEIVLAETGEDSSLGFPYYVMNRVEGHIIREDLPIGVADDEPARRRLGATLVDVLADLHAVAPDSVGLGDFGRPEGFLARQLRRWGQQFEASRSEAVPELTALREHLERRLPSSPAATIVHGDYRLDNCMIDAGPPAAVAAVLDWEMSTLGDPLTDLGMLLFYWREAGEPPRLLSPGVTATPGFPTRREVAERYAVRTGLALDDLWFYEAFAHFKFAVIAQGIQARAAAGAMAGQDFGDLQAEIRSIAAEGLAIVNAED